MIHHINESWILSNDSAQYFSYSFIEIILTLTLLKLRKSLKGDCSMIEVIIVVLMISDAAL